ncbi:MAG TPA: hypothetical protein VJ891_18745 [Casimicrobiaceae bacterium]|nr:hypothetical protein [Casimicrobiaceae bacterium]
MAPSVSVLARTAAGALDPYANDETTRVTVEIAGVEYPLIRQYSIDSDVLNLGDPCAVELPNPNGRLNGKISLGDPLKFYMADPSVAGGQKILVLSGIVTGRRAYSNRSGTFVSVAGADLGWHLVNNDAPLWFRLRGVRWSQLLQKCIDPSWNFAGYRLENDTNTRIKLGRQGVVQQITGSIDNFIPPIQIEPGEKVADLLILYAKRERKLVNVSSDGYLQLWAPNYGAQALFHFDYHRSDEPSCKRNNVESATLVQSIDGLYTRVQCVGTVVRAPDLVNQTNPNEGQFIGSYIQSPPVDLPFLRRMTFSDGDQLTKDKATARALWRFQRSKFDAFIYQIEVKGHAQGGAFYTENTLASVDDTVNGVSGLYYVSAVKKWRERGKGKGTRSVLTLRLNNLLAA